MFIFTKSFECIKKVREVSREKKLGTTVIDKGSAGPNIAIISNSSDMKVFSYYVCETDENGRDLKIG